MASLLNLPFHRQLGDKELPPGLVVEFEFPQIALDGFRLSQPWNNVWARLT